MPGKELRQCGLRIFAKLIHDRNSVHTGNRAVWGAWLDGVVFAFEILDPVLLERNSGVAALLRAVMHKPILTDVQVTAARVAMPIVWKPVDKVSLEAVRADER